MPRIKIEKGYSALMGISYLKVYYYKDDAYFDSTLSRTSECFTFGDPSGGYSIVVTPFELEDLTKPNELDIIGRLLQIVEGSINQILNYKTIESPLDEQEKREEL